MNTGVKKAYELSGSTRFLWVDLEMTGLNPEQEKIIEIASILTDESLNIVAYGPSMVIHQSDAFMDQMSEWVSTQHAKTGLTQEVRESNYATDDAERETIAFLDAHVGENDTLILAGNSVHQDRRFIRRYMPHLEKRLHYRIVDVSTVKILVQAWYSDETRALFKKEGTHRALDDIVVSIEELRYYRTHFFMPTGADLA